MSQIQTNEGTQKSVSHNYGDNYRKDQTDMSQGHHSTNQDTYIRHGYDNYVPKKMPQESPVKLQNPGHCYDAPSRFKPHNIECKCLFFCDRLIV